MRNNAQDYSEKQRNIIKFGDYGSQTCNYSFTQRHRRRIVLDFAAIDFETANGKRSSACSIGIVQVRDGKVVNKKHLLIKPPVLYFHPINVSIHGISADDVRDKPQFNEIWPEIKRYFEENIVIAHNASFDVSVLRSVLDTYGIQYPETFYSCTIVMAKKLWPNFDSYRLNALADRLGIKLKHHDAQEDALACAQIAMEACRLTGVNSLQELANSLEYSNGRLYSMGYEPVRTFSSRKVKKL